MTDPVDLHEHATDAIRDAVARLVGPDEPHTVVQAVRGVAWLESRYGTAWGAEVPNASHNWGCVQYATPSQLGLVRDPVANPLPEDYERVLKAHADVVRGFPLISPDGLGFLWRDTRPTSSGGSVPYAVYFRRYTESEAADGVVRTALLTAGRRAQVLPAARRGDWLAVSEGLHATRYYEGFGATVEERIARHHRALVGSIEIAARTLGEQPYTPPTLDTSRPESELPAYAVRLLLDCLLDTELATGSLYEATRAMQRRLGRKDDGVVGAVTWSALRVAYPELPWFDVTADVAEEPLTWAWVEQYASAATPASEAASTQPTA